MPNPNNAGHIRILLVGSSGSGKSATGNTILNASEERRRRHQEYFKESSQFRPETSDAFFYEKEIFDQMVTVVDTPGAYNTIDDYKVIQREIRGAILNSDVCYDAIVIVSSMLKEGLTLKEHDRKVMDVFEEIMGKDLWKNAVLLFTYGDYFEKHLRNNQNNYAESFPQYIKASSLSTKEYAPGRYAKKVDFAAVRFENHEQDINKKRKDVRLLFNAISNLKGRGYGSRDLPPEKFIPVPRYDSDEPNVNIQDRLALLFKFVLTLVAVVIYSILFMAL